MADTVKGAGMTRKLDRSEMCQVKDCEEPFAGFVEVDIGPTWDEYTVIAATARLHRVRVCGRHLSVFDLPSTPKMAVADPNP